MKNLLEADRKVFADLQFLYTFLKKGAEAIRQNSKKIYARFWDINLEVISPKLEVYI